MLFCLCILPCKAIVIDIKLDEFDSLALSYSSMVSVENRIVLNTNTDMQRVEIGKGTKRESTQTSGEIAKKGVGNRNILHVGFRNTEFSDTIAKFLVCRNFATTICNAKCFPTEYDTHIAISIPQTT